MQDRGADDAAMSKAFGQWSAGGIWREVALGWYIFETSGGHWSGFVWVKMWHFLFFVGAAIHTHTQIARF